MASRFNQQYIIDNIRLNLFYGQMYTLTQGRGEKTDSQKIVRTTTHKKLWLIRS